MSLSSALTYEHSEKSRVLLHFGVGVLFTASSMLANAQSVLWEDYRGNSGVPSTTDASVLAKPTFANANSAGPIDNLIGLLELNPNDSGAVRTGNSPNIDWRSSSFQLCESNTAGSETSCALQAMGRVAYTTIRFPAAGSYTLSVAHDDNVRYQLSNDFTSSDYRAAPYTIPVGQFADWTANDTTFNSFGDFTAPAANSCARLRVYWTNQGGVNHNRFRWTRPDGITEIVPDSAFLSPEAQDSSACPEAIYVAAMELTKIGTLSTNEETITYTFSVRNTGNVPLTNVTVTDPKLPGLTCSTISTLEAAVPPEVAAPQAVTCTANNTYTVTPSDRDAGQVVNTATANGLDPNSKSVRDDDSKTTLLTQSPAMTVAKSVTSTGPYILGSIIRYQFVVANTGDVTLNNIAVNDPLPGLSAINCPATSLALNASTTCTATYTVTQDDVNAGNVHNTATASGTPPSTPSNPTPTQVTSPPSPVDTPVAQTPSLTVAKSVTSTGSYKMDSVISYQFVVTNTGTVPLTAVVVNDPLPGLSAISCPATSLALNASTTCTATYTVTQDDVNAGNVHNTATASGTPPATPSNPTPTQVTSPPSPVDTPVAQTPSLTVAKSVTSTGPYKMNSVISYQFVVTNTGTVPLTAVVVNDPLPGLSAINCPATSLALNASTTCTATYTVTQDDVNTGNVHNTATASGTPPATPSNPTPTQVTSPPSPVDTPVAQTPSLTVAKSVTSTGPYKMNSVISYQFVVTNTGTVPLTAVVVDDPLPGLSAISCPATSLALNASTTCTATYTVTQDDVNAGNVHNTATASGTPPATPSNPTPTQVTSPPSPVDTAIQRNAPTPVPTNSLWFLLCTALAVLGGARSISRKSGA